MRSNLVALSSIALVCFIGLSACNSNDHVGNQQASSHAEVSSQNGVTNGGKYQASLASNGAPEISANGQNIVITVNVTNTGSGTFGSTTTPNNVNLAAHGIDAAGKIVDQDLARANLPQVTPGATAVATILLPIDRILGKSAEILPVQENVAWFDKWGTKPLKVGPFEACSDAAAGKVCDSNGKPLPVTAQ